MITHKAASSGAFVIPNFSHLFISVRRAVDACRRILAVSSLAEILSLTGGIEGERHEPHCASFAPYTAPICSFTLLPGVKMTNAGHVRCSAKPAADRACPQSR